MLKAESGKAEATLHPLPSICQSLHLKALAKLSGMWIDRLREQRAMRELIMDMDSNNDLRFKVDVTTNSVRDVAFL